MSQTAPLIIDAILEHEKLTRKSYIHSLFGTHLERNLLLVSIIAFTLGLFVSLLFPKLSIATYLLLGIFVLSTLALYVSSTVIGFRYILFLFPNYIKELNIRIAKEEILITKLMKFETSVLEDFEQRIRFERGQISSRVTSLAGDKVGVLAVVTIITPVIARELELSSFPSLLIGAIYLATVFIQSLLRRLEKLEFLLMVSRERAKAHKNEGEL